MVIQTGGAVATARPAVACPGAAPLGAAAPEPPPLATEGLSLHYGTRQVLEDIHLTIPPRAVTALIGPSGAGKTSLLGCLNRLTDMIPGVRVAGSVRLWGQDVYTPDYPVTALRRRVGMVFDRPQPFAMSIGANVAFGLRLRGVGRGPALDEAVERALCRVGLWDDVRTRLGELPHQLSRGQQQLLCVARALAVEPDVLLMDEPCGALDPVASNRLEAAIAALRPHVTVVIVTHNLHQAARLSDCTGLLYGGRLMEFGPTARIFTRPAHQQTEDYVTGRVG